MKVSSVNNNRIQRSNNVAFKGFSIKKDDYGEKYYRFSYPCDYNRYDCYLSIVNVEPQRNGDYKIGSTLHNYDQNADRIKLHPGMNDVDVQYAYRLAENQPFAYQYQIVPKAAPGAIPMFKVDAGDLLDERSSGGHKIYNLVVPSGSVSNEAGSAILLNPDNYDVRWMYDKNRNIVKNPKAERNLKVTRDFGNFIGGSLAGVEHALDSGELDPYSKIFMLPFATGDNVSAQYYWPESLFQLSGAIENMQDYARLQQKLFAKGKNLVSDAAITSEGLSGIHFQSILNYGPDNIFFDWFKCNSLKDMTAKLGVFGKKDSFIRHKLVNAPFVPEQDGNGKIHLVKAKNYNPKKPTYVQVYNIKQTGGRQAMDNTPLIKKYENPCTDDRVLNSGTHNDTVVSYSFPINPKTYEKNVKRFNEYVDSLGGKSFPSIDSYEATRMLTKFEHFEFENKFEGGFYTWDANVDMVKYNYGLSNADIEEVMHLPPEERARTLAHIQKKNCEVQDYAVSSVKYWARKTNQILNLYTAQSLKNIDGKDSDKAYKLIVDKINNKELPNKLLYEINPQIVKNVMDGDYTLHGMDSVENIHNTILSGLMDFPLESAELGKDILSLFSTPYMTKRATHPEEIGKSRFQMQMEGNPHLTRETEGLYKRTNSMYASAMMPFAQQVLTDLNNKLPKDKKLDNGTDTSAYGKYVIPILTQEIAKFAVMKGLVPDLKYSIDSKNGGIIYDYNQSKQSSLKSIGIQSVSQKRDTDELITKMYSGIKNISDADKKNLVKALEKMIDGTSLTSFKLSEMIVDRAKGGLDFRFDAAKDVANMDGLRNGQDSFEDNWEQVIDFWKNATQNIYEENPNSYIVAEVTDELDLHRRGNGGNSDRFVYYKEEDGNKPYYYRNDIVKKFLRETGITATANYNYFFTDVAGVFGKLGESGVDRGTEQGYKVHNILKKGRGGEEFLYSGPYDSVLKSYTFVDNHDKPRILQFLSMDRELFYANLNDPAQYDNRKRAFAVLNPHLNSEVSNLVNSYDYSFVSPKAIARGESLNTAFYHALEKMKAAKDNSGNPLVTPDKANEIYNKEKEIIAEIVSGEHRGKSFEADNFGVIEFQQALDVVLRDLKRYVSLSQSQYDYLEGEVFARAIEPAMSNALAMDKFLINLPGIPTTYAGDDLGATGDETKTKNIYLKNRGASHPEWVEKYPFVKRHKDNEDYLKLLRMRPALHALNDGAPFLLPMQYADGHQVSSLLRYGTDGSAVISLFNVAGTTHTYDKYSDASKAAVKLANNQINISKEDDFTGLNGGLTPGMEFINANDPNDKYYVYQEGGMDNYFLAHANKDEPIVLKDNTLTLYHASDALKKQDKEFMANVKKAKDSKTSFCGRGAANTMAISSYSKALENKNEVGKQLALVSR